MTKRDTRNLLMGLDVGTSKVVCVIGEVQPGGQLEVIGLGQSPSRGLKRGVVINIDATVEAIRQAVGEAEMMANARVQSAYVGLSGAHIKSHNSVGVVPVSSREVSHRDVEKVIEAGRAIAIPADQRVIHVLAQEYVVDNQEGILRPEGMFGVRLEAKVHIVTGSVSAAQNLQKCVESCGIRVEKLCLQHIASSGAVLLPDEKDLGICMVDLGGGTSDIAVFKGGSVRHTAVLPIAGEQVTNDISVAFRTPSHAAEEIKIKYGCALPQLVQDDEEIEVPSAGEGPPRHLSRRTLSEVIRPRYEELFRFVRKELQRSEWYESIAAGVVLTGAASMMPGVREVAEEVFELPTRIAGPHDVIGVRDVGRSPAYATAVGLLIYTHSQSFTRPAQMDGHGTRYWVERISNWFKGNF
ncbi:MAG: cell division protein FtsA [Panacagrimonas sp.]